MRDCRKVIPFDECFTTSVGDSPTDVKPTSICGQYLEKHPIQDIQRLIDNARLKSSKSKSKCQNKKDMILVNWCQMVTIYLCHSQNQIEMVWEDFFLVMNFLIVYQHYENRLTNIMVKKMYVFLYQVRELPEQIVNYLLKRMPQKITKKKFNLNKMQNQ